MMLPSRMKAVSVWLTTGILGVAIATLTGCDEVTNQFATGDTFPVSTYEATATVTYTWQVEYVKNLNKDQDVRRQTFASTSLVNRNGQKPDEAVTGPDDQGLWWPKLPPRPTVDELEGAQHPTDDQRRDPQLLKDVKYAITFDRSGQRRTLPTNYGVYREATKAFASQQPLELTFGPGENAIAAAKPTAEAGK